jgi:hypothetical protein
MSQISSSLPCLCLGGYRDRHSMIFWPNFHLYRAKWVNNWFKEQIYTIAWAYAERQVIDRRWRSRRYQTGTRWSIPCLYIFLLYCYWTEIKRERERYILQTYSCLCSCSCYLFIFFKSLVSNNFVFAEYTEVQTNSCLCSLILFLLLLLLPVLCNNDWFRLCCFWAWYIWWWVSPLLLCSCYFWLIQLICQRLRNY